MSYCEHPGCLTEVNTPEQQERHDQIFDKNCGVMGHGCFTGPNRTHMLMKRHHECGFGNCKGQGIKFKKDADARRHWNKYHRDTEALITEDRYGRPLDDEDDGYYSEAA